MSSSGTDLVGMLKTTPRPSVSRGSMMNKQIKGLTVDEVKESLFGLLPDYTDFVNENIIKPFCLSDEAYNKILKLFNENLDRGLNKATNDEATVKMWPSFVRDVPNGTENGKFIALDFGSHHLKIEVVTIVDGQYEIDSQNGFVPDKIMKHGNAETLFDYLACFVHRFLKKRDLLNTPEPIPMGFTFAFPCQRLSLTKAVLVRWTKNMHCDGVVGEEVVGMLEAAIKKKGEMNIMIDAVVNDTVGTLMSGAVEDPKCAVGLILSKGTNACYIEKLENVGTWEWDMDDPKQVIIITEWCDFGNDGCLEFISSEYDKEIDKNHHTGKGIFEKMISGQYLGELVRLVLQKLRDTDILFQEHWTEELGTRERFYTKYVSEVLSEEDIRFKHTRTVYEDVKMTYVTEFECRILHHICQLVSTRAATLVALGTEEDIRFTHVRHALDDVQLHQASEMECRVVHHVCQLVSTRAAMLVSLGLASLIDRVGRSEVGIAVDGALYRFHPLFHDLLMEKIPQFLKQETKFWLVPAADRSGKGAAVAAAVTERLKRKE